MQVCNSEKSYGALAILFHWVAAVVIFGLFALGYYMVDLSYYDEWYRTAPDIHRSVGMLLLGLMSVRLLWRLGNPKPRPLPNHTRLEVAGAHFAHWTLYLLTFTAMVSGYLISTADGSSIDVFDWVTVPSFTGRMRELETIVADVHYWSTWALVILATFHGLAGLKHHFIDRDETLKRILRTDRKV